MQLGAAFEQRLGVQDVGATGQRAEGNRDVGHLLDDRGSDDGLPIVREAARNAGCRDHVTAVVHDSRRCQRVEHRDVGARLLADEPELLARRGGTREVAVEERRGTPERFRGRRLVAEEEGRLAVRGREPVRVLARSIRCERAHQGAGGARQGGGTAGLAGDQPHGRRVDARVGAPQPAIDLLVPLGRDPGRGRPIVAVGRERAVLGQPRLERGDVLDQALGQIVTRRRGVGEGLQQLDGLARGAGAHERQRREVGELEVAAVGSGGGDGPVECLEVLAAGERGVDRCEHLAAVRGSGGRHRSDSGRSIGGRNARAGPAS